MSNAMTQHTGSTLAVHQDQQFWTDQQMAALQQLGVATNSQGDLAVFFHQAQKSGLDPFKREIYMITRSGKPTIQTGIDGFYKIADRVTTKTRGTWGISETYWCGQDGQWVDVWLQQGSPAAAKVIVERNGSKFTTVALTSEYTATGPMWKKMPARMIAKCAEALAIRKAFPEDLNGMYTNDEMERADAQPVQQAQPEQDFHALLEGCQSRDDLNAVAGKISAAGRMNEFRGTLNEFWKTLAPAEPETDEEVVDGTLVDEATGEIQGNAA